MLFTLTEALREAVDYPFLFLLYVVSFFALALLITGIFLYIILYIRNRKTAMKGIMKVRLSLNEWPQPRTDADLPNLVFGEFFVPMHDPAKIRKNRLDPHLGLLARARRRQYAIGTLLARFTTQYRQAGFQGDAGCSLLETLLKDTQFCEDLGFVYRRRRTRSLAGFGCGEYSTDAKNPRKLRIFSPLPTTEALRFYGETSCQVENLCVTLEYFQPENEN